MTTSTFGFLLLALAATATISFSQGPEPAPKPAGDADKRIETLEKKVTELAKELAETKTLACDVMHYLSEQAGGAESMARTLDESEQAGFTYGVNPESRSILLRGWRDQLASWQKNLPKLPDPKAAADAKSTSVKR
jgi:hypothetical protein